MNADRPSQANLRDSQKSKLISNFTQYNLTFGNVGRRNSLDSFKSTKAHKKDNSQLSKSCIGDLNVTYSKYPFFHNHTHRYRQVKCRIDQPQQQNKIKWIGVHQVSKSFQNNFNIRNAFPQRNKKGSNQLIINMLMKYDKYQGRNAKYNDLLENNQRALSQHNNSSRNKNVNLRYRYRNQFKNQL